MSGEVGHGRSIDRLPGDGRVRRGVHHLRKASAYLEKYYENSDYERYYSHSVRIRRVLDRPEHWQNSDAVVDAVVDAAVAHPHHRRISFSLAMMGYDLELDNDIPPGSFRFGSTNTTIGTIKVGDRKMPIDQLRRLIAFDMNEALAKAANALYRSSEGLVITPIAVDILIVT